MDVVQVNRCSVGDFGQLQGLCHPAQAAESHLNRSAPTATRTATAATQPSHSSTTKWAGEQNAIFYSNTAKYSSSSRSERNSFERLSTM